MILCIFGKNLSIWYLSQNDTGVLNTERTIAAILLTSKWLDVNITEKHSEQFVVLMKENLIFW